jgi:CRP-like cAMP-binding protein
MSRTVQPDGRVLALENLGPGDCFGELPLITGRPWDVRVRWLSNGIAMRLSEVVFRELLCAPLLQALSPQQALAARATGAIWVDVRRPEVHRQDKRYSKLWLTTANSNRLHGADCEPC